MNFSSRVLAGVLSLAGHFFEKWHLLKIFDDYPIFVVEFFKQGASRGAASGGSYF